MGALNYIGPKFWIFQVWLDEKIAITKWYQHDFYWWIKNLCVTLCLKSKSYKMSRRKSNRVLTSTNTRPSPPSPENECQQWVKNFPATVTISSIERKATRKCRRKFTARSSEKIGAVRASVGLSLKQIIRRNSQELRISYVSLQRILNVDLHLHSMHIYICIYIYVYLYLYL